VADCVAAEAGGASIVAATDYIEILVAKKTSNGEVL